MGLFGRLFGRDGGHANTQDPSASGASGAAGAPVASAVAPACDEGWVEVPAFLDMEAGQERSLVCAIASAIAAGDNPSTQVEVRRVGRENPEYRRVCVIASAIAAADRPESSFSCVSVRRRATAGEENHAA